MKVKPLTLLNVILATSLLTALLFTSGTIISGGKEYDPWSDYNDDGVVDIQDLVNTISLFGTHGDTTKNVTVTNFPLDEEGNLKVSVAEKPSKICKDAVKISLVTSADFNREYCVRVDSAYFPQFPFAFCPRETFMNVTGLSIFIVYSATTSTLSVNVSLNGVQTAILDVRTGIDFAIPITHHIHVEDDDVYNALHSGINIMSFQGVGELIRMQELSLFIEYEYQA